MFTYSLYKIVDRLGRHAQTSRQALLTHVPQSSTNMSQSRIEKIVIFDTLQCRHRQNWYIRRDGGGSEMW